jgi:hypothetical protein
MSPPSLDLSSLKHLHINYYHYPCSYTWENVAWGEKDEDRFIEEDFKLDQESPQLKLLSRHVSCSRNCCGRCTNLDSWESRSRNWSSDYSRRLVYS